MKQKIVNLLKYNKCVYTVYFYLMSFLINFLKLFIKPDDKLILFNSFAGRKYDDSPKAIFEAMKNDERFKGFHFVWAFHQPEKFEVDGADVIKTDGFKYFKTALSARVWITNSSVERGLSFKGKHTLYVNTWHGTPIKLMGTDISDDNQSFKGKPSKRKTKDSPIDMMNSQSRYETEIFSRVFNIPRERFIEVGLPRNDELANYTDIKRIELRKKLQIPIDAKVILYCPTFREYDKDKTLGVVQAPPVDFDKWRSVLGDNYVVLFRAHYEVSKVMDISDNEFIRDVTNYASLNELMIISDMLISDYSSIFFDYSIMDKPMFHFTYDYDKYEANRGMYFDIRECLSGADNEDELLEIISNISVVDKIDKTRAFRLKYVNFYGSAAKKTVNIIAERLS